MKIWYDTEFIEKGRLMPLQLVSIGCVREDGAEWYGINEECLSNVYREPWMAVNVVPHLPIRADDPHIVEWNQAHDEYPHVMSFDRLRSELLDFLTKHSHIQLWADFSAYDHVVLAQIFGTMNELPSGIPMRTRDIRDLIDLWPTVELPPDPVRPHHALEDARWCRDAYYCLRPPQVEGTTPRPSSMSQQSRMMGKDIVDAEIL